MDSLPDIKRRLGGLSVRAVVFPTGILLLILHCLIIFAIVRTNQSSRALSAIMHDYNTYIDDASALHSGSVELSESAYEFALAPVTGSGRVSVVPLLEYAQELRLERTAALVQARFRKYPVGSNARQYVLLASESAARMERVQQHAIALIREGFSVTNDPVIANIPGYPLIEEEKAMSPEEKKQAAVQLLFGEDYSRDKTSVSVNTTAAISVLRADADKKTAAAEEQVASMRTLLWLSSVSVFVVWVIAFAVLFLHLVGPLVGVTRKISDGGELSEAKGLFEMRLLAFAYNSLRKRQDALEANLRTVAETDPLTELPNRYRFDRDMSDEMGKGAASIAIFSFDLNYLKRTNDTKGHAAGDRLLRSAARCISECFGQKGGTCYRLGGDEFAAILRGVTLEEVEQMEEKFEREQERYGVSIAMGRAYTEQMEDFHPRKLLLEADRQMYDNKAALHGSAAGGEI